MGEVLAMLAALLLPLLVSAGLLPAAHAETLFVTDLTQAARWPGDAFVSLSLSPGDAVEVVVRDGELVRVRKGGDFGWVAASALSPDAPPVAEPPALPDEE